MFYLIKCKGEAERRGGGRCVSEPMWSSYRVWCEPQGPGECSAVMTRRVIHLTHTSSTSAPYTSAHLPLRAASILHPHVCRECVWLQWEEKCDLVLGECVLPPYDSQECVCMVEAWGIRGGGYSAPAPRKRKEEISNSPSTQILIRTPTLVLLNSWKTTCVSHKYPCLCKDVSFRKSTEIYL